jgi:hypothetical protein
MIIIHDFGSYHHVTSSPDHLGHPISTKSSSLTILTQKPMEILRSPKLRIKHMQIIEVKTKWYLKSPRPDAYGQVHTAQH